MTALAGLRVVDLTRLLPGPFCTMLLGDLGADVIKVEEPGSGDPARHMDNGSLFALVNRNKRSLTLDLKQPAGRELLLRLVDSADVLVEGFRPGVMERLTLDYPVLRERNPRLVYASLSGYGQSGPYRDRPGHDLNYVALAGLLGFNVDHDGTPVIPSVQTADLGGAVLAAVAILAAIVSRSTSGVGQSVDVSLFASAVAFLPALIAASLTRGHSLAPGEPMLSGGLPQYGVYATADGRYVTLGALEPKFLLNFLDHVGRRDLLRVSAGQLRQALKEIFASRTLQQWVADLDAVETCFAPVNTLEETLRDPQARALDLFASRQINPAFTFSETPASVRRGPPELGEHNREILGELGLMPNEIDALAANRVV